MKQQMSLLLSAALMILVGAILLIGCSVEEKKSDSSFSGEIIDSFAVAVAENITEAIPSITQVEGPPVVEFVAETEVNEFSLISDMILVGSDLYVAYDGGVIQYDLKSDESNDIFNGEKFTSLALYNDQLFAGGEQLYTIEDGELIPVELALDGQVQSLATYEYQLIIGTDNALYNYSLFGSSKLMEDVTVTSMAADQSGLWVGTSGQGLYRWNGVEFQKRFLKRDESLFDNITTVAYGHKHTYIGTDDALYVYDGGSWLTLTADDGLPTGTIRSVDANGWVIYIATDDGVVSYFDTDFIPVKKLSEKGASAILVRDRKIFVGTETDGLVMKSGPALKTLIEPQSLGGNESVAASF